jgi:CspA family cold shock protein
MATGNVKWFNNAKGFGFITPHDGSEDVYAHHSQIKIPDVKVLKERQEVAYDIITTAKDNEAANITALQAT